MPFVFIEARFRDRNMVYNTRTVQRVMQEYQDLDNEDARASYIKSRKEILQARQRFEAIIISYQT